MFQTYPEPETEPTWKMHYLRIDGPRDADWHYKSANIREGDNTYRDVISLIEKELGGKHQQYQLDGSLYLVQKKGTQLIDLPPTVACKSDGRISSILTGTVLVMCLMDSVYPNDLDKSALKTVKRNLFAVSR